MERQNYVAVTEESKSYCLLDELSASTYAYTARSNILHETVRETISEAASGSINGNCVAYKYPAARPERQPAVKAKSARSGSGAPRRAASRQT